MAYDDDDLNLDAGLLPAPKPKPAPQPSPSRLPDLLSFADQNKLTLAGDSKSRTIPRGGHNVGSKHYSGNAIDIAPNVDFNALSKTAAASGFRLRDERTRPKGQKVWTGPHGHLEVADQDPLNLDAGLVSAPPKPKPQPKVAAPVGPVDDGQWGEPATIPQGADTGIGAMRKITDPEVAPVLQQQREIEKTVGAEDPLESPRRRQARVAQRLSQTYESEARQKRDQPELDRLTKLYRDDIQKMGGSSWLNETLASGGAGVGQFAAGLGEMAARLSRDPQKSAARVRQFQLHAQAMERAATEAGADRGTVSKFIQKGVASAIGTTPELAAMMLTRGRVPAPAIFGAGAVTRAVGRREPAQQVAKEGLHAAAGAVPFEFGVPNAVKNPFARAGVRAGTVGAGTYGIERAGGATPEQAGEAALSNVLMTAPELVGMRRPRSAAEQQLKNVGAAEAPPATEGFLPAQRGGLRERIARGQVEPEPAAASEVVRPVAERVQRPNVPEVAPVVEERAPVAAAETASPELEIYLAEQRKIVADREAQQAAQPQPEVTPAESQVAARPEQPAKVEPVGEPVAAKPEPVELPVAPEVAKPEQTADEAREAWQKTVERVYAPTFGTSAEAETSLTKKATEPVTAEMPYGIRQQIAANKPISVADAEAAGVTSIQGYERRGNRYVPSSSVEVAKPTEVAPQAKPEVAETPQRAEVALERIEHFRTIESDLLRDVGHSLQTMPSAENTRDLAAVRAVLAERGDTRTSRQQSKELKARESKFGRVPESEVAPVEPVEQPVARPATFRKYVESQGHEWGDVAKPKTAETRKLVDRLRGEYEALPKTEAPQGPAFVKRARAKVEAKEKFEAEGGEFRGSGGPDTEYMIAKLVVDGYDFYAKTKPKFEAWAKEMRDRFGEKIEPHLRTVWAKFTGEKVPESIVEREPSTTAAKNAAMAVDREELGLPELEKVKGTGEAQRVLAEAKAANAKDNRAPDVLVEQALKGKKNYDDVETMQVDLRAQEIKNRINEINKEVAATDDPKVIQDKSLESDMLVNEFDRLSQAVAKAGTEWSKAGRARQRPVDQNFDLASMTAKFRKEAGRIETPKEKAIIKEQAARIEKLEADLAKANDTAAHKALNKAIEQAKRVTGRQRTRTEIDTEWTDLKAQFAQIKAKEEGFFKSERGEFDPEAIRLLGKMLRNRVQAGVNEAGAIVDQIHGIVGGDKRELRDALSGYSVAPKTTRSALEKEVSRLRAQMQGLSRREDIAAGVLSQRREGPKLSEAPKQGPKITEAPKVGPKDTIEQIRKRYADRIAEVERRIREEDFSEPVRRQLPIDTAETKQLKHELLKVQNEYGRMVSRQRGGHHLRNISGMYKAWLLSGPLTHVKNIGGTAGYQVFDEGARVPAVVMDAMLSTGRKAVGLEGRRTITASPSAMLSGVDQAIKVGLPGALEKLRHGATTQEREIHQYNEIDFGVNTGNRAVDKGVKTIELAHNAIFRFMSASDHVFYNYSYKRNLADRATAQAINEGLKGEARRQRVKELSDNPTEQLKADADHDALVATFNNNNALSTKIKDARGHQMESVFGFKIKGKKAKSQLNAAQNLALDLVLPFDRTPTNVVMRVLEGSPIGFAKLAGQTGIAAGRAAKAKIKGATVKEAIDKAMSPEDQRQFAQTFGRATAGTALVALGWTLADKLFDVDDKGYVSLKLGSRKIRLDYISPLGNIIAAGVKLRKNHDAEKSGYEDVKVIGREATNIPLLRATSGLTELGQDPQRSIPKTVGRQIGSAVPFSGAVRTMAEATDTETDRKPKSVSDYAKMGIPGLRQQVPVDVKKRQKTAKASLTDQFRSRDITEGDLKSLVRDEVITEADKEDIMREGKRSDSQSKFANIQYPATALERYERMDDSQQREVKEIMKKRGESLIKLKSLTPSQRQEFKDRLRDLGFTYP